MVRTEDLELAGEVVQDAAAYLGLTDLESTAHFPDHMQDFQAVLAKVSACAAHMSPSPAHMSPSPTARRLISSDGRAPTTTLCLLLHLVSESMACCNLLHVSRNCERRLPVSCLLLPECKRSMAGHNHLWCCELLIFCRVYPHWLSCSHCHTLQHGLVSMLKATTVCISIASCPKPKIQMSGTTAS